MPAARLEVAGNPDACDACDASGSAAEVDVGCASSSVLFFIKKKENNNVTQMAAKQQCNEPCV
jgi:hypothetical protein